MAEALGTSTMDCPVCLRWLTEPKILLCGHHMCKKCVLTTLKAADGPVGCPSCHQPILPAQEKGEIDYSAFVASLPTNHATWMKVLSHEDLRGDTVCSICDENPEVVSYCFQCDIKMCKVCSKFHSKMPCSSDHTVAELNTLSANQLAVKKSIPCNIHPEKAIDKYCPTHAAVVCHLCAWSDHKSCLGVEDIAVSAETKRKDLRRQCEQLKQRGIVLSEEIECLNKQIAEAEAKFDQIRKEVIARYADVIKHVESEKHQFLDDIDEEEQAYMEEKLSNMDKLEALQAAIAAHAVAISEIISDAPDVGLLKTLAHLKSRLDDLETKQAFQDDDNKATVVDVYFDDKLVDKLKEMSGYMGDWIDSSFEEDSSLEEEEVDLDRCFLCGTVTEGTVQLEVQENILRTCMDKIITNPFIIRNIAWRIVLNAGSDFFGKECLWLSLRCILPENMMSCNVKYELKILTTLPHRNPLQREFEHTFKTTYGFGINIISITELMDPTNGYMKDGKITVEVHVVPDVPECTSFGWSFC